MQALKHILAVMIVCFLAGLFYITDRTPEADENVYMSQALTLYKYGVFGVVDKNTGIPEPGARVAPLYPAMLAGIMFIDKNAAVSADCHLASPGNDARNCPDDFFTIKIFQLILLSFFFGYIWYLLVKIFASRSFAYLVSALLLLSGTPFYFVDHYLTESLYLAPAFIFLLTLSIAILQKDLKYTAISAGFLALVALTRPTYLYLFYLLILIFPVMYLFSRKYFSDSRHFINFNLVFIVVFALVVGPWVIRNNLDFDKISITVGYSDKPLSTRIAHNDMTNKEYLAGWIYYLPDFGDSLAEKIFGYETVQRLGFGNPQSFYPVGREKIIQRLNTEMNATDSPKSYSSRLDALLKIYVYPDVLNHAKVTLLMAWRGFFVEKYFGLLGLFFLIWAVVGGIKNQHAHYFHLLILPPLVLLFFQAGISVSIPRYNLILLLPLSIAIAAGLMAVTSYIRKTDK